MNHEDAFLLYPKRSNIYIMKRFLFLLTAVMATLSLNSVYAQSYDSDLCNETTMSKQEAKKAARAAHKAAIKAENEQLYNNALQALKDKSWVIEVDQIVFPRGLTKFVSKATNFVSLNDNTAVVQLALSHFDPGQNGLGGFTVKGNLSKLKMSNGKHGIIYYNFIIQGIAISATVNIQLTGDSNRATVTIYPNFNNNNITLTGNLVPYSSSIVFQGQTI